MKTSDMPVIELAGTPRERGIIYGTSAKQLIAEVLDHWQADLGNFLLQDSPVPIDQEAYIEEFFSNTDFIASVDQWTPDLLDEVKGIAEGSAQSYQEILGLQLLDEEWAYGLRRGLGRPATKCTAFAVPSQRYGISYAGQNMDVPSWVEGRQVLLKVAATDDAPEAFVFSSAGNIGLNGLNANGLGITCNTLVQLQPALVGVPVSFIVRAVLAKQSIDEAEHFLRAIPHASGQNYMLSAFGDIRCFECCGTSVMRYTPEGGNGSIFHSNHPLVSQDFVTYLPPEKMCSENSVARLESISGRLGHSSFQSLALDDIKSALAAHDDPQNPVSRNSNKQGSAIGYTAGSSIYETGDIPKLHLAAGPPCITDYEIFSFANSKMKA